MDPLFKKGDKFRCDGYLYHIVLPFEDNGEMLYVVKYYGKYRKWWHYDVFSEFKIEDYYEQVRLRGSDRKNESNS